MAKEAFSPSRTDVLTPVPLQIFRATKNNITWFAQFHELSAGTSFERPGFVSYPLSYAESNYIRNVAATMGEGAQRPNNVVCMGNRHVHMA
jgi:hypothetical protein